MKGIAYMGIIMLFFVLSGCAGKDKYDVTGYYDVSRQDSVLTDIVTYIYTAPQYTLMEERFDPGHRDFYLKERSKFKILKYYIDGSGRNYFLVSRPGPSQSEKRCTGGYFQYSKDMKITGFREVFVTPVLAAAEAEEKGIFLFDQLVKGSIDKYTNMEMYVQWPNPGAYYDTITYQWKMITDKDDKAGSQEK